MKLQEIQRRLEYLTKEEPQKKGLLLRPPHSAIEILKTLEQQRSSMSDEDILKYAHQMHYVARFKDDQIFLYENTEELPLYFADSLSVCQKSCSFEAKPLALADNLTPLGSITTYHSYGGYPIFLRPSIDEAIWQCPKEWLNLATAFEFSAIKQEGFLNIYNGHLDCHVLKTTYYQGLVPNIVKQKNYQW